MLSVKPNQTVFRLNIGNGARYGNGGTLHPVIVRSVGRKYFRCSGENQSLETEYHLETGVEHTECNACSKIYVTREEWENQNEAEQITKMIRSEFDGYGPCKFPLETLRQIKALIRPTP